MTNIRFIQFPHPGREHQPGPDGKSKAWNWLRNANGTDNSHARTFFQVDGVRLTDSGPLRGPLWAWGEWEAEARVVRPLIGSGREPTTLFEPYWVPKGSFENLHNTDPFVFGGFFYTDCKQGTSPSLIGMRQLAVGSVILYGSGFDDAGKDSWVLDAVLVVADYVDHNVANYQERLHNRVPEGYEQVVLGPTYSKHAKNHHLPRRLYIGATHAEPLEGMFSFFPCIAPNDGRGFARPEINLPGDHFNPKLRQGMKGHGMQSRSLALPEVKRLWAEVRDQVRAKSSFRPI